MALNLSAVELNEDKWMGKGYVNICGIFENYFYVLGDFHQFLILALFPTKPVCYIVFGLTSVKYNAVIRDISENEV